MSTITSNKAAYLDTKGGKLDFRSAPVAKPGPGQLLVRNRAVAINPVDGKMQDEGLFIQKYPTILGCDLAGEVAELGPDVQGFSIGQRVLAHPLGLATGDMAQAPFQEYTIVQSLVTAPIPDEMSFEQACVLPLSLSTAASGLYGKEELNLPYPTLQPKKTGKTLLVWGGSSSVGSSIIQLARHSGLEVVATASEKNFEYCKSLGARAVFDHSKPSIVGDLVAELQKGGEVAGAYDAIATREASLNTAQVLAQLGGGFMASVLAPAEDRPATVNSKSTFAPSVALADPAIGKAVYGDFLPDALKAGKLKAKPDPDVVGTGLESLQSAIDKHKAGVSASKIVVSL